jgi:hypothetical protein
VAARTIVKDLEMTISNRIPVLTPQGHVMLAPTDEARTLPGNLQERLDAAFERASPHYARPRNPPGPPTPLL